ncbi:MAG: SpoIIE family protein phosphatase [Candidatus Eisenbacteria bacterium]|uniref:SpoIIE family protein phosphatase n=1 Tax=Eiseniibacteriota bacterium TaxID=2212470 RepID=A0A849SB29_UNCEI|nr:SpoIIE family protein phosphatase [Candidatus Eisenbacteria bacterium]
MDRSLIVLATLNLSLGGLAFLLGLLILRENPRQRLNRVVSSMLFFAGFGSFLAGVGFLGTRTLAVAADTGAGAMPLAAMNPVQSLAYLWEFFFPTLFLFACLYPHERRFTRRPNFARRWLLWPPFELLVLLPHIVHFVVLLALGLIAPNLAMPTTNALRALNAFAGLFALFADLFLVVHQSLFSVVNLGFGLAAIGLLVNSWQKSRTPRVREQLGVITIGLSLCLALYVMSAVIPGLSRLSLSPLMSASLTAGALLVGAGSIAYAIVRYKFLDVRLLARRGILYGLATALVIGAYLGIVTQARRLLTAFVHVPTAVLEPVFLIVALIVFQPILGRLEELLDRLFLGDPADHRNVLRQLGRELLGTLEIETLLTRSVSTIGDALVLRRAALAAFARDQVLFRSTTGRAPEAADLTRLRVLLAALPEEEETLRVADGAQGLEDSERDWLVNAQGIALIVPLRAHGELLGALLLGPKETGTGFTSEDVHLLGTLAGQMAVSLQNALLVRDREQAARLGEEMRVARQIQHSFLMSEFPILPRFEVHATSIPSKEVGGDLYDLVQVGEHEFVVTIADVAGKGVPAALMSSMLQASLRTQAPSIHSCAEILRNLNSLVYRGGSVHQFATLFVARIRCDGPRITFSNAGHNYPVLLRQGGQHETLERGGTVLGILEGVRFDEGTMVLESGDRLLLYTDGITEAAGPDHDMYGEERLYDLLRSLPAELSAREITERVLGDVRRHLNGHEALDDMTLMALRVLAPVGDLEGPSDDALEDSLTASS